MRSFLITCSIFLAMIVFVLCNALYINRTVDEFITTLQITVPNGSSESTIRLQKLQNRWEKDKKYVQASVSHLKIDAVSNLISSLLIYNEFENQEEYKKTAALLCAALEELRLLEKFSAENIF